MRREKLTIYAQARVGSVRRCRPDQIWQGTTDRTEAGPGLLGRNSSIPPPTSHVAFYVLAKSAQLIQLDRLSRYEATLWRQAGQILFALDALDRRKPQERGRRFRIGSRLAADGRDNY